MAAKSMLTILDSRRRTHAGLSFAAVKWRDAKPHAQRNLNVCCAIVQSQFIEGSLEKFKTCAGRKDRHAKTNGRWKCARLSSSLWVSSLPGLLSNRPSPNPCASTGVPPAI
jgi:hypothetical protein